MKSNAVNSGKVWPRALRAHICPFSEMKRLPLRFVFGRYVWLSVWHHGNRGILQRENRSWGSVQPPERHIPADGSSRAFGFMLPPRSHLAYRTV